MRNRLVPTPEGRQFYGEIEASYRGMDTLRAAAARIRDQGAGEIRVATLSALGSSLAIGASWGGTRSLVAPMAIKGDRTAVPWTHPGVVLRISIGLEDPDELWRDLAVLLDSLVPALATAAA